MELTKFAVRYCHQLLLVLLNGCLTMVQNLFLELVRCSLDTQEHLSINPSEQEWVTLFDLCQKQTIAGVVFIALDKLSRVGQKPPTPLLYEWIGLSEQIKQQNDKVNRDVAEIFKIFENNGFDCILLKGQGNNLMYPDRFSRTPGDIDMWVRRNGQNSGIKEIVRYVKYHDPAGNACYHHVDYGRFNGTEVEVHYRPAFMFRPKHNRRLQRWFESHTESAEITELGFKIPTAEFNVVFQLSHVYNHLLHEGIGLRQIIDYFYVLKHLKGNTGNKEWGKTLKCLGLWEIAGAMMWVQSEVLGLEDKFLIAPKDEKRGKIMLEEIMRGGNFGFYDTENKAANNRLKKNIQRIKRDIRMMRYFPSECLWEPLFRVYHLAWRIKNENGGTGTCFTNNRSQQ